MSLDVFLTLEKYPKTKNGSGIFVRENGETKEITRAEWGEKFPGREPVVINLPEESEHVYERNMTHNLANMAAAAGVYEALWRPEEIGITKAIDLILPVSADSQHSKLIPLNSKHSTPRTDGAITTDWLMLFRSIWLIASPILGLW